MKMYTVLGKTLNSAGAIDAGTAMRPDIERAVEALGEFDYWDAQLEIMLPEDLLKGATTKKAKVFFRTGTQDREYVEEMNVITFHSEEGAAFVDSDELQEHCM